ncbi:jg24525 [Pararge aegeria aegeria]|uniref:Jg24525 protein n=1 Tax=Pararge aegeria aegeria TaxID=348720 RepID=A0A8S4R4D2_9NEOP|nr:jg24525 [Pararge aegeria aegeria]
MYRNKKDVDKHVDSLMFKLSPKDFKTRAYSIARLYFEVGDYGSCQKYVEQYLTQKSNNAAAHKLLGQAFQKLGQKEKAIEQYKTSLDIDPTQTSTILDVCELLADDDVTIDSGRAKYWCEKAEAMFPKHPVTFSLREKLLSVANPDPEALVKLLKTELDTRPKDAVLHIRLIQHLLRNNKIKEAFDHSCNIELDKKLFSNNYAWYESLSEILKYNHLTTTDWLYQLLLLTVKERICVLSLTEVPNSSSKGLVESSNLLHDYDQSIESVAETGPSPGFREFHNSLLKHHQGQLAFHTATFLLKKTKKGQFHWREIKDCSATLMLIAWQTIPIDPKVNWLTHAPEKQQNAVRRWYLEGSYRCSQSGHFLLANMQDKSEVFIDEVSQFCSKTYWKDSLYEKTFSVPEQLAKKKSSHLVSDQFKVPLLRLPRKSEVQAYDDDAQREYPNSLHHFVWILLNYKNYAEFRCTLFDMLSPSAIASCGPETLNKMDILAFLYSATFTAQNLKDNKTNFVSIEMPGLFPANITDLLCSLPQTKWWDCAYKFSQNELGMEYTDIRSTLSRGIEVVRCIDNHALDPELLCILGRTFITKAKKTNASEEKANLEVQALLYYSSAIPLLEKLKSKTVLKIFEKRMFDYTHKQLSTKEINLLLEESKLQIALSHLNDGEYEKVINLLSNVKSPQAYYYLSETYKKIALEETSLSKNIDSKYGSLLNKAKHYAYKALNSMKNFEENTSHSLYTDLQTLIEDLESQLSRIDIDLAASATNDVDLSDEYSVSEIAPMRSRSNHYQNVSSTPKQTRQGVNVNATAYRTAIDSQTIESAQVDQLFLDRIEKQINNFHKTETTINVFMDQTRNWFEENRKLGNHIISTINSHIENTTDQFKDLKISVDQVKEQIDECRNESKDVKDLKKQIAELKKEVNKLKKTSTDHAIDESVLYNLENDYRTNDNPTFTAQLPFQAAPIVPPFAQRLMPPFSMPSNPYQLYGQNFYNLYNQYSQFAQPPAVPGASQMFDPTRAQMNYPGVYPTPDQMYLDVAHLVPPTLPTVPTMPSVPTTHNIPAVSTVSSTSVAPKAATGSTSKVSLDSKENSKSLPVNVVITSSDPLPTCTTVPAPVLSVTIPQKHVKGSPHNYQIPLPSSNDCKTVAPPVFSFPTSYKSNVTTASSILNWNSNLSSQAENTLSKPSGNLFDKSDKSESVVDGIFTGFSPNTSINKSRTLSERSNTSIDNYDPCPDFKPIIPLPAEVKITTGEEDETVIFSSRAKLFRFVDKQWKERGIGVMKLLKHKVTGKVRVLMRREQVHKICANHIISPKMELNPMTNETKAYCWMAHDYAEETVILEKFCIRFKTADLGKEFYETFEKARKESSNVGGNDIKYNSNVSKSNFEISVTKVNPSVIETTADIQSGKPVVGGFTFSSKPSFKAIAETTGNEATKVEAPKNKINVFSGLTFNAGNSFTFGNNLNLATSVSNQIVKTPDNADLTKLNTSDVVEDFEPTAEFKPVVPLPALVNQKTGEEDEIILFEHRAKLLRFDVGDKEWKERGLGNIKLLVHKESNKKLRLLMRREQIMKVCCNHSVTKEMSFQKMPNMDKAVTWCAKDFSEGELVSETFCLRFKTAQICDDFIEAVKAAQIKICDDAKAVKEEQNAAKQNNQIGFGDRFKPKPGSWFCKTCYTNNLETFVKCACCETPNPELNSNSNNTSVITSGWGDKFKPKPGSWECKQCFIRNDSNHDQCCACNSSKDGTVKKTEVKTNDAPKFNFGIPSTATQKPSETRSNPSILKTPEPAIFSTSNVQKFTFGIPKTETLTFGATTQSLITPNLFSANKVSSENASPINYSVKKDEMESVSITPVKAPLLETPKTNITSLGKSTGIYEFSFKPSTKGKSPVKSPKDHKGDDSDDNEYASEDEGHHIHFSPVIAMPEKIEVVTGEEQEEELYCHRAKLFIFNKEWKERGVGNVKILKHKETGNLRVLMRRDQIHKICLNHTLVPEIIYKPKDDKTWLFYANDFSEGQVVLQHFCLRFKNKEIALQFTDAVDKALAGKKVLFGANNQPHSENTTSEDVVFVTEIQASSEEKQRAKELMLPENFYTYKNKEPCSGCRGCEEDNNTKPESEKEIPKSSKLGLSVDSNSATPLKNSPLVFQSPTSSVYGTPSNFDRSTNTTMFRTPLSAIKSNTTQAASLATSTFSFTDNDSTDKENTLTDSPNTHISSQPVSFVTGGIMQNQTAASKTSILAAPKLNMLHPSNDMSKSETETIAHTDENKPIFGEKNSGSTGLSTNKSIFSFNPQINKGDSRTTSIFSDTNVSQVNLFSNNSQESIFGPAALKSIQSKPLIFGNGTFSFGTDLSRETPKNIFGVTTIDKQKTSDSTSKNQLEKLQENQNNAKIISEKSDNVSSTLEINKSVEPIVNADSATKDILCKADSSLTFEALVSSSPSIKIQEPGFKWEGAGQQLFVNTSAKESSNKSKNNSGAADDSGAAASAEEEYDPHYEPIVPMPDKIVVTTGEEDEQKLFGERCKLFRFDDKSRDWKERGVGEMKILYHPQRNSYRFLLRREQVHKAVLNMLLFMDLNLLPLKNSVCAWTWAGQNFAESEGEHETLAAKFKTAEIAEAFHNKVVECVRKIQASAAQAIRNEKEGREIKFESVPPLRLPKHLEGARADSKAPSVSHASVAPKPDVGPSNETEKKENGDSQKAGETSDTKQVQFEEPEEGHGNYDDEDYEHDYENAEGYEYYYGNEDEEESSAYYPCKAVVQRDGHQETHEQTHIQVSFDQDICSPKILVTDYNTGEILADMLIHTDTEFQLSGDTCSWSGADYTSNVSVEKSITVTFPDSYTALEFYDSCETSKATCATYASTDPES